MTQNAPCVARHINHVALAVKDINDTLAFYGKVFGVTTSDVEELPDQRVKAALVRVGGSQLEIIQPTDAESGVAKFIDKRGEGVHHIAFEVDDLQGTLTRLGATGVDLIDKSPRHGLSGTIGFIHPKATRGVLIELVDAESARR
ncbi:MAG: methylmalonyl-CoA epimerase [SAR202 cluster bacterium]|nr:methylmalonyl-CoA epimerase [SAR202 cluster bacterium]